MQGFEWLTGEVWVALVSLLAAAATVGFLFWSNRKSEQKMMHEFDVKLPFAKERMSCLQ